MGAVIAIDLITKEIIYNKALKTAKSTLSRMYCPYGGTEHGASFDFQRPSNLACHSVGHFAAALMAFMIYTVKALIAFQKLLDTIIGGAIGNLVDRAWLGYVRDFVYFELIDFAVFNLATALDHRHDIADCVRFILL